MNMDDRLFQYYVDLKRGEAGKWNASPQCLHTEMVTREYIRKSVPVFEGIKVCNVGIGTGDWDDYLGYWLEGKGTVTSIDIDEEICELFAYRQRKEEHPNPSEVLCKNIFDADLPVESFDAVTMIGSAINEAGNFNNCLDSCFRLLKDGGRLMFMANLKYTPEQMIDKYIERASCQVEKKDRYETFPEYPFYIYNIKKI